MMSSRFVSMNKAPTESMCDYLAKFLAQKQVKCVFELSGGMIAFITDAISKDGNIKIVNVRHEQAAGFAAEGASRSGGIPSVALATSGPGATNLVTAIGSAYFDSTPVLFITGQVHQSELRKDENQRQNGFQELNIVKMVEGITKFAVQVNSIDNFKDALENAWAIAVRDRPGPVLIDIPINIQQLDLQAFNFEEPWKSSEKTHSQVPREFGMAVEWLNNSKKPLILVGGGVRLNNCISKFRKVVDRLQIPVVHSLMGVDALSIDSNLRVGMIGSYGNRWANKALATSDTLLVLGSRLDVRQTGNSVSEFSKGKRIIRVDVDRYELNGRIKADLNFEMNLDEFLYYFDSHQFNLKTDSFLSEIRAWEKEYPADMEQEKFIELNPNTVMQELSEYFHDANGYLVDVGQHQMWAAQSLSIRENQRFITSGGMGAMGFSIPAALGCAASTGGKWVAIAGDGCVQLSLPELQTLKQYDLSVAVCIINNDQLGMVAQFQEENMDSRFTATRDGYSNPDFLAIAEAFGIPAIRITSTSELAKLKGFIQSWSKGPIIIEIQISQDAKALPKLTRNSGLADL
jgi:acetolactate synthase I/II/III large subunit